MKQILTTAFMLFSINAFSQDTTGVMITLEEVIFLDYKNGLEILDLYTHDEIDLAFTVKSNEVLCLHFYDNKKRYRDVIVEFENDPCMRNTFSSFDYVLYTVEGWGNMLVSISEPRRRK